MSSETPGKVLYDAYLEAHFAIVLLENTIDDMEAQRKSIKVALSKAKRNFKKAAKQYEWFTGQPPTSPYQSLNEKTLSNPDKP